MGKSFSAEENAWIVKHHNPDEMVKSLTAKFNIAFSESRSVDTMKHHIKLLGLHQTRRNFTADQDKWLIENAPLLSVLETAQLFNAKFGTARSDQVLKVRCNRNLKTYHANSKYGLGCPIGTETMHSGYVWVKVSDTPYSENSFYLNWKPKHHIVWERENGALPDGMTIVFLDRNRSNCSIDNLYAVSGKVKREMAKKKWFSDEPDLTLAAIKWCELFYALKELNT